MYHCNTCKNNHEVGEICSQPILDPVEVYKSNLIKVFDKFNCGYGDITGTILLSLRRHLFEPETLRGK